MNKKEAVLEKLNKEKGWKLFDSLSEKGRKLVSDTIDCLEELEIEDVEITEDSEPINYYEFTIMILNGIFYAATIFTILKVWL